MEYMRKRLTAALTAATVLAAATAWAVPPGFNVQGRLTDANGVNREGSYAIQFTIFDASTGGAALWTKTFASLPVRNGNFQTVLGDTVGQPALTGVFSSGDARYLEIQVLSGPGVPSPEPALIPRQQLVSVPFALKSAVAENASSLTSTGTASVRIVDGTQGAGKVLTSDAAGVATWQVLASPASKIFFASFNPGTNGTADFVISLANFKPTPPAGTTFKAVAVNITAMNDFACSSTNGFHIVSNSSPGSPFGGTNPSAGIYLNPNIGDHITFSQNSSGSGGCVNHTWSLVGFAN